MKKMTVLVSIILVMCMLVGCSSNVAKTDNGLQYNKVFNEAKMVDTTGAEHDVTSEDCICYKTSGIAFMQPSTWTDVPFYDDEYDPYGCIFYYYPAGLIEQWNAAEEGDAKDELADKIISQATNIFSIFGYKEGVDSEEDIAEIKEYFTDGLEDVEELMTLDGRKIFFAKLASIPDFEDYTETDRQYLQTVLDSLGEVRSGLMLFPSTDPIDDFKVDLTSFSAKDINGNSVDQSIFADYDVTMINVWTTWCQYCIEEMPSIQRLSEDCPSNVNVITICMDADEERETALSEIDELGIKFPVIVGNDELFEKVKTYIKGYPTTFYVDSNGKLLNKLIVGTPASGEEEIYQAYMDAIQELLDK